MRAWFLQGEQRSDSDALGCLLRQWASRPENHRWSVDCLRWTANVAALVQDRRPDVLLIADPSCPAGPWLEDVLAQGIGLVVATSPERVEPYLSLAEQYAVQLMPLSATVEEIGLAFLTLAAGLQRQRGWQTRLEQLQQRLNDRILIEKAKGILVERLAISEKEAYQRMRLQSRRQRRPIRDIAQCLLDAHSLFSPHMNGIVELSSRNGQTLVEQTSEEA
ncbi:MAG TPA: ANTAR domain-containing protein [Gemmataceae bacterium]|nr:ANTAR domain-containing protein [Gemmataceae bacterium]